MMFSMDVHWDTKLGPELFYRLFKPMMERMNVKDLAGRTVAVDAYSMLYKGAVESDCCRELCLGIKTTGHVDYCIEMANLLKSHDIKVMFVFHGKKLKLQEADEIRRSRKRIFNLGMAKGLDSSRLLSSKYYRRALIISSSAKNELIEALEKNNVEYIVAPYDANAQLTFLAKHNHVSAVISEDSDLIPFGCPRVIYKMDKSGDGYDFQISNLFREKHPKLHLNVTKFNEDMIRLMCVLSGCKYYCIDPSIAKIYYLCRRFKTLEKIKENTMGQSLYPWSKRHTYESCDKAVSAYKFHKVYDPSMEEMTYLTDLPPDFPPQSLDFLGPDISKTDIKEVVKGAWDECKPSQFGGRSIRRNQLQGKGEDSTLT